MAARRAICRVSGANKEMPLGDKPGGSWARAISLSALSGGGLTATIPAGFFLALPVVGHTIQSAGTRDYVFRLTGLTLNADKSVSVTGLVRQSRMLPGTLLVSGGNETFETLTSAVVVHLSAEESD